MKVHVECKVGLRAFEKLKPYYVRRLKEHNTCACKYYIENGGSMIWLTIRG
jgi:hypothetical protein